MDSVAKITQDILAKEPDSKPPSKRSVATDLLTVGKTTAQQQSRGTGKSSLKTHPAWRRALLIPSALLWILLSVLLCASPDSFAALASEPLQLTKIKVVRGTMSDQGTDVLLTQQQSGSQDDWATYLEAAPDAQRFMAKFVFHYDADAANGELAQLRLRANTLGTSFDYQRWKLEIRNVATGKWQILSDNKPATAWLWYQHDHTLTDNPSEFINRHGNITIRYWSNNAYDVSNIDLMQLNAITETDEPVTDDESNWWQPGPQDQLSWQWQINGELNTTLDVDMYDIDLFDTSAEQIQALKSAGSVVVCYFSAGTYEGWRPDWQTYFPYITNGSYSGNAAPFAAKMSDWDERWLDIRELEQLAPIMRGRLQLAVDKGCDAVEPDNVDSYSNASEVQRPISYADQLRYNRWLAAEAHKLGLSIGLKNDVGQLVDLVDHFDWALNEQCFQYQECEEYAVFTAQGKAVFGVEYQGAPEDFCPQANSLQLFWLKKRLSLKDWQVACSGY